MTADGYATDQDRASVEQAAENARLRAENAALRAILAECVERLPGWAGVNDDAHGWYCRAKTALHLHPWELPAPPLTDELEGE
jgi:hypothetical protein